MSKATADRRPQTAGGQPSSVTGPPSQASLADWAADQAKVANISELHRASGKDRATVVKLLNAAGLKPKFERAREKFYDLADATAALSRDPREIASAAPLTHARTQKTTAEAARIVLKLQRERGELAPRSEFREEAFNLVKGVHTRFTRYAKEARRRFKLSAEQARQMETDFALIFDDLKRDYPEIL
jgi:hypothetical protein